MKAIILAGGFGSRLSEETSVRPTPMVEIGGMPIVWRVTLLNTGDGTMTSGRLKRALEHTGHDDTVLMPYGAVFANQSFRLELANLTSGRSSTPHARERRWRLW